MTYLRTVVPAQNGLVQAGRELEAERFRVEQAGRYDRLRRLLEGAYGRAPRFDAPDDWLFHAVKDASQLADVSIQKISGQSQTSNEAAFFVSLPVAARLPFAKLARWIQALENREPELRVTSLLVVRDPEPSVFPKAHSVNMTISTVIPKKAPNL